MELEWLKSYVTGPDNCYYMRIPLMDVLLIINRWDKIPQYLRYDYQLTRLNDYIYFLTGGNKLISRGRIIRHICSRFPTLEKYRGFMPVDVYDGFKLIDKFPSELSGDEYSNFDYDWYDCDGIARYVTVMPYLHIPPINATNGRHMKRSKKI